MRKIVIGLLGAAALLAGTAAASAQGTVKIGLIMPYSGQFADTASQMDNAIKLYVKEHGDTVAGKKIEFIRKDTGGIAPDVAKRLAQELVTRDKVDIIGGLILTPNALAVGDVSAEAKKFAVIMNAGDLDHHHQVAVHGAHLGDHADAEPDARHLGGQDRLEEDLHAWCPTTAPATTPKAPSSSASRRPAARSSARCASRSRTRTSPPSCSAPRTPIPDAIYIWIPGGTQPAAVGKALAERGIDPKKIESWARTCWPTTAR